jgi:hypothetical protein
MRIGAYELTDRVAESPVGAVWRGQDESLGRSVAIKQVAADAIADLDRLRSEARVLAGLAHDNIVRVVDLIEADGQAWLIEEWVDGLRLDAVVAASGRLDPEQATAVVHGALSGLAYAHGRGLVHGDVSPGNVLVDVSGTSRLVDFGLARPIGSLGVAGTPGFVSPEAVNGLALVPASDVYSAAALLAMLLLGRPVFAGTTPSEVLAAQLGPARPDLSSVPGPLRSVLDRAMATEAALRPADAAAFLAELEPAADEAYGPGWLTRAGVAGAVSAALSAGATAILDGGSAAGATAPAAQTGAGAGTASSTGSSAHAAATATKVAATGAKAGFGLLAPLPLTVAGVVAAIAVAAGVVFGIPHHSAAKTPIAPVTAAKATTVAFDLASYAWSNATVPMKPCTGQDMGEVTLRHGTATFQTPAAYRNKTLPAFYVRTIGPIVYGTVAGTKLAVLTYICGPVGGDLVTPTAHAFYVAGTGGPKLVGTVGDDQLGKVPGTSLDMTFTTVSFPAGGGILVTGKYYRFDAVPSDPQCCPSGKAWTTLTLVNGVPTPSGIVHLGTPPSALPTGTATPTPTPTAPPTAPPTAGNRLITYNPAVGIASAADVSKLVGAPDSFKQAMVAALTGPRSKGCTGPYSITVEKVRLDGFAVTEDGCDNHGEQELWATDGSTTWTMFAASEDVYACAPLRQHHFPSALIPGEECYTSSGITTYNG